MSLVDSLLDAIVRLDGDALVMHVGEKPYVVTTSASLDAFRGPLAWGQVELASRRLSVQAVASMVDQLLPPEERSALSELGAVQYDLPARADIPGRFTVIAARGGDDIWLEIRYHRPPRPQVVFEPARVPARAGGSPPPQEEAPPAEVPSATAAPELVPPAEEPAAPPAPAIAAASPEPAVEAAESVAGGDIEPEVVQVGAPEEAPTRAEITDVEAVAETGAGISVEAEPVARVELAAGAELVEAVEVSQTGDAGEAEAGRVPSAEAEETVAVSAGAEEDVYDLSSALADLSAGAFEVTPIPAPAPTPVVSPEPEVALETPEAVGEASEAVVEMPEAGAEIPEVPAPVAPEGAVLEPTPTGGVQTASAVAEEGAAAPAGEAAAEPLEEPGRPAVVVPLARPAARVDAAPAPAASRSPLDRLLRLAAARGASALYIVAGSRPVLRVEGEIRVLDAEEVLAASDVAAMLMELAPEPTRDALRTGAVTEWICDVPEVGRVRCMSFRDHRGPGGIFRMLPARALSAEQLGLSRTIQSLCEESEGLVLVAGPRASGKSTLIAAFVDQINRTRADHVITLETQIMFVHESRRSFVSQREWRERGEEMAAAARAALREDPDVLVIDDLRSPDLVSVALDAAGSGRLVFAALPASGTAAAIERVIDQFPADRRAQVQTALAASLRAVVAQVLVRKIGGGRVAAREVLLGTRPVAALVAEGRTTELAHAIEGGRRHGMVPMNDALVGFVRAGLVDPAEAYRRTPDRESLLAQLRREGIDTSFVERLA